MIAMIFAQGIQVRDSKISQRIILENDRMENLIKYLDVFQLLTTVSIFKVKHPALV